MQIQSALAGRPSVDLTAIPGGPAWVLSGPGWKGGIENRLGQSDMGKYEPDRRGRTMIVDEGAGQPGMAKYDLVSSLLVGPGNCGE